MSRRTKRLAVFVLALVCVPCNAQERTILKNADVVRMTESRLDEEVILALIQQTPNAFSTTPKDLAMILPVPVPLELVKSVVDPVRIIKEGVGWGEFDLRRGRREGWGGDQEAS